MDESISKTVKSRKKTLPIYVGGITVLLILYVYMGTFCFPLGFPFRALFFEARLLFNPRDYGLRCNLGQEYAKAGFCEPAEKQYDIAVHIAPSIVSTRIVLAQIYAADGKAQDAINVYLETLVVDKTNTPMIHKRLGDLYQSLGDKKNAIIQYKLEIQNNGDYLEIQENGKYGWAIKKRITELENGDVR